MAGTGGARPGAGRKRKLEKHVTAINKAEKQIKDRLPELIDALTDLALGTKAFKVLETGDVVAYETLPDRNAGQYLVDRIMGKPVQRTKDEDTPEKLDVYSDLIREMRASRGLDDGNSDSDSDQEANESE